MEIQKLSPDVIDQIAAGEVVERPAHLVKELIENSIDAGATKVEVTIEQGGKRVVVKDNGLGLYKEDLELSCSRHATSKIQKSDDLWNLSTYGFRGEALASISSVSQLTITSKRDGESEAYKYENHFGKSQQALRTGSMTGTTVEINKLFQNVPARLKFLKSDSAELTQIKSVIKALALAYPEIDFILKNQSKTIFRFQRKETEIERVQQVLGCKNLYQVVNETDSYKVDIIYSSPTETFGTRKQIWGFVQGRWVEDKTIMAAVMEAYRSLLMHGEYPYCVVRLTVPKDDVDVNIHPTKSQVKFKDNKVIFQMVNRSLRAELEQAPWLEGMRSTLPENTTFRSEPQKNLHFKEDNFSTVQYPKKNFQPASSETSLNGFNSGLIQEKVQNQIGINELQVAAAVEPLDEYLNAPDQVFIDTNSQVAIEPDRPTTTSFWSHLQVLGQTHLTYILAEARDSLYLIDQHAAHERVVFEQLMEHWQHGKFDMQKFLLPITMDLTADQCEALVGMISDLEKLGIEIEQAGPETIMITAAPTMMSETAMVKALQRFADEVSEKGGSFSLENTIADVFATMACHSVVRAGQSMSTEEMKSLLQQMDKYSLSSYCPHGRNVYVELPYSKIDRDFGRTL